MGMNYVIDYKTLEGERIGGLDQQVREQLAEGYQPLWQSLRLKITFTKR